MVATTDNAPAVPSVAPSVVLRNLSLAFQGKKLFERLELTFATGCCTCILGASGCGKSTLLKMVAGSFSHPYSGEISIQRGGEAAHRENAGQKGNQALPNLCAFMGQDDLLLPWFSVLDNVLLGARLRGELSVELRQQGEKMLDAVGLAACGSLLPEALSGGMRQRVALARTLMENRPIMLMDEPFSALDALTRQKMQELAARLTRGRTVLLVTHDPLEALRLGDSIVVLGGSPSQIVYQVEPKSALPRSVTDATVQEIYPQLLSILLKEGDK